MEITLTTTIPDITAANLQSGSDTPLPRRLLELAAIKAYESSLVTEHEVMNMLGFKGNAELSEFFIKNDVRNSQQHTYTAKSSYQRTLGAIGRRQEAVLHEVESSSWPEESDIPEAPINSSVKEFLL